MPTLVTFGCTLILDLEVQDTVLFRVQYILYTHIHTGVRKILRRSSTRCL